MAQQTKLNMLLQVRRVDFTNETNAAWKPAQGEPCFCTVNHTFKVGDGQHTWAELPFANEELVRDILANYYTKEEVDQLLTGKLDKTTYEADKPTFKTKQTAYSATGSDKKTVTGVTQNANGEVEVTFGDIDFSAQDDKIEALEIKTSGISYLDTGATFISYDGSAGLSVNKTGVDITLGGQAFEVTGGNIRFTTPENKTFTINDVEVADVNDVNAVDAKIKAIADDYVTDTVYQAHLTAQAGVDEAQDEKIEALENKTTQISYSEENGTVIDNRNSTIAVGPTTVEISSPSINFTATADDNFTINGRAVATTTYVQDVKTEVIGTDADTADSATIAGAKAYADARKQEVVEMIDGVASAGLTRSIVTELPAATDAALNTIYMIKRTAGLDEKDVYDEYIVIEVEGTRHFELLGNTELDLSNYYTKLEADNAFVENNEYVEYKNLHENDYTNTQIDNAISTAVSAEENRAEGAYSKIGHKHVVADITDYATDVANKIEAYGYATVDQASDFADGAAAEAKNYADKELSDFNTETVAPIAERVKAIEDAPYTTKKYVDDAINELPISSSDPTGSLYTYITGHDGIYINSRGSGANIELQYDETTINHTKKIELSAPSVTINSKEVATQEYVDKKTDGYAVRYDDYDIHSIDISAGNFLNLHGSVGVNITTLPDAQVLINDKEVATQEYVDAQITEKAGVTKVVAGKDIVVTPAAGTGEVTVAHETFVTGEYTKDPATSDKTGDQYFFTGVTVDNGHVTGANVKSIASVLEAMTFILDGGTSIN